MAANRSRSCYVRVIQVVWLIFHLVAGNERLARDDNLTRVEITTILGQRLARDDNLTRVEITTILGRPVNLGCYVTKNNTSASHQTQAPSTITYVWLKDNQSVPQTPNSRIHENVLVVTPKNDTDFGIYECNVTNGVSSTRCRIELKRGWTKAERGQIVTGCVNISVLMPVLAVAVLSFLLFIHLLIKRKDNGKTLPETPQQEQKQRRLSSVAHPHAEQRLQTRRLSRDLLYNSVSDEGPNNKESKPGVVSIEMHVGGDLHSTPETKPRQKLSRRERKKGFYNKSFRNASVELDDVEMASHVSGDKTADEGNSPKEIGFYNTNFQNDSMDSIDNVEDYSRSSVVAVFGDSRGDEGSGAYKTFRNESMESTEDADEVFVDKSEGTVLEKSKSGNRQGFINKRFHTDSMDLTDDCASTSGDAAPDAQDATNKSEGTVLEKSKSGNRQGFFNKTFHTNSMDLTDDGASTSGDTAPDAQDATNKSEGAVLDKSKSGNRKGFFNKTFHTESMDLSDDDVLNDGACTSGDKEAEEAKGVTAHDHEPSEDTYF